MNRRRFASITAFAVGLALSGGFAVERAQAAGPVAWKKVTEDGWKGEVPKDWSRTSRTEYGHKQRFSWLYQSPKRNFSFKVSLLRDRGEPLKQVMTRVWNRTRRGLRKSEIIKQGELAEAGRQISITIARAVKIRRTNVYGFLVGRLVARTKGSKVLVSVQVDAHGDRIDDFNAMVTRLMEKLALDNPDQLFAAKK